MDPVPTKNNNRPKPFLRGAPMNQTTISRQAKYAVLLMIAVAASLLFGLTCQAVETSQAHLVIHPSSTFIWIRIGSLPKSCDSGIFKRSLLGPVFQYIDDPLDSKPDPIDHQAQVILIARLPSYGACS
jgi:hypothetical protein